LVKVASSWHAGVGASAVVRAGVCCCSAAQGRAIRGAGSGRHAEVVGSQCAVVLEEFLHAAVGEAPKVARPEPRSVQPAPVGARFFKGLRGSALHAAPVPRPVSGTPSGKGGIRGEQCRLLLPIDTVVPEDPYKHRPW
jgi:hypothetical protein